MHLTSTYYIRPKNNFNTSSTNFFSNPDNLVIDETVSLVKNLRMTDLKRANLVLDLKNKKVLKCRRYRMGKDMVINPDYQKLYDFFKDIYPNELDAAQKIADLVD